MTTATYQRPINRASIVVTDKYKMINSTKKKKKKVLSLKINIAHNSLIYYYI